MHVLCMCVHHHGTLYYYNTSCTADMPLLVSEMKENIKLEAIASHIVPACSTTLTPGNLVPSLAMF